MKRILTVGLVMAGLLGAAPAWAQTPPPPSDAAAVAAKAKAAEAAAKAAHAGKVDAYKLCKSMDAVAERYYASAKASGKETKPPVPTPACVDPGPFVFTPPAPAASK